MDCKKKKSSKGLLKAASIISSLLGIFLLVISQAVYVQEKTLLQTDVSLEFYDESLLVKFLDILGCLLLALPILLYIGMIGFKLLKSYTKFSFKTCFHKGVFYASYLYFGYILLKIIMPFPWNHNGGYGPDVYFKLGVLFVLSVIDWILLKKIDWLRVIFFISFLVLFLISDSVNFYL